MSTAELQQIVERLALSQQETARQMQEISGLFTSQWGKLVEALMRPARYNCFRRGACG